MMVAGNSGRLINRAQLVAIVEVSKDTHFHIKTVVQ
jgi:hypothetical protein